LVQLMDVFEDKRFCYVVMDICICTVLDAFLDEPEASEGDLAIAFRQMSQGVAHCHSVGVVHRDIKPQNFLVAGSKKLADEKCVIKLCDFGMAIMMPKGKSKPLKEVCGTAPFMAPEMLMHHAYDYKVDVWALGVTSYLMLFGVFPYNPVTLSAQHMKTEIKEGKRLPNFQAEAGLQQPSPHSIEFVKRLLEREPKCRVTAEETLKLTYVKVITQQDIQTPTTKDIIRQRKRVQSLKPNIVKAAAHAEEVMDRRTISPQALDMFEEELTRLQAEFGLYRRPSERTMTLPSPKDMTGSNADYSGGTNSPAGSSPRTPEPDIGEASRPSCQSTNTSVRLEKRRSTHGGESSKFSKANTNDSIASTVDTIKVEPFKLWV